MTGIRSDEFLGTAANALERMAFVITEPSAASAGEVLAEAGFAARVEIRGDDRSGWLVVVATAGFVREVAAGMLGLEADEVDVDDHGDATVAELANVLGGEMIMLAGGGDAPFRLGLPAPVDDERTGQLVDQALAGGFVCVLAAESGKLLLAGSLDAG